MRQTLVLQAKTTLFHLISRLRRQLPLKGKLVIFNSLTRSKRLPLKKQGEPFQLVKEVSPSCELSGIMGKKENRRGDKNGTVAAG